ncbi:MAG: hypothetical protein A2512_11155 [Deltaproteobacteria bacterium RIFOXYD12_FULL_56_24]|nr:MAG: hypothetical protein A2512_11155 [Deltaproteobacteria bacterium RIFOXYD12_FULL_56_24]
MDKPNNGQDPDAIKLESIITDLARQLQVETETIRPILMCAYRELTARAVVKDFVSIFAMRMVRDRFSGGSI